MDDIRRPQRAFVLALLIACYVLLESAVGADESSAQLHVGSKFTAMDTLACGIDADEDAAAIAVRTKTTTFLTAEDYEPAVSKKESNSDYSQDEFES